LLAQLRERRGEPGEPRALLLDDVAGRARDEPLVGELGARLRDLALVPRDFDGYIWTNRIEVIGPAWKSIPAVQLPPVP